MPLVFLCKFGQNPPVGTGDRVQTRLIFYSLCSVLTLKIRSRSPKSDQIFKPTQRYNVLSLARICRLVQEIWCRQAFFCLSKFEYFIVWWPWKWGQDHQNEIFKPSQCYNIWSLATIYHLVQEMGCRQAFFGRNLKLSKCWCDLENEVKVTKI